MDKQYAIFDTVGGRFVEFSSTGTVPHKTGGYYVPNGGTFVFTTTDEAIARGELAHLTNLVKQPGRYQLFEGQFA